MSEQASCTVNGVTYLLTSDEAHLACNRCVAKDNTKLCHALDKCEFNPAPPHSGFWRVAGTERPPTEAEWQLIFWQRGSAGSFTAALFNAAACADLTNLTRLAIGFPDEIAVFRRYSQEPGYWQALQQRATPTPADDPGNLIEGE